MALSKKKGSYVTAAATTAGFLAVGYYAFHLYDELKKSKLPTTWKQVGTLKDIYFYPIKSCGSIQRNTAECTFLGLKDGWLRDRILMVVDEKNHFVTGRAHPKLLLIQPTVTNSILTLSSKDMEPIEVDLEEITALHKPKNVCMWDVKYPAYDLGWQVNEWLSRFLVGSTSTFKLMLYAARNSRRDFYNKIHLFSKNDNGAFADEVPFNLINQASIDDLNTRLNGVEVSHKNFRPNFILTGAQAYDEDNWKFVKIGDNVFEIVTACVRCIMATNNPETGERNKAMEPLATLKTYRQHTDPEMRRLAGSAPRMGLQMVLRTNNGGIVSINDAIYVA